MVEQNRRHAPDIDTLSIDVTQVARSQIAGRLFSELQSVRNLAENGLVPHALYSAALSDYKMQMRAYGLNELIQQPSALHAKNALTREAQLTATTHIASDRIAALTVIADNPDADLDEVIDVLDYSKQNRRLSHNQARMALRAAVNKLTEHKDNTLQDDGKELYNKLKDRFGDVESGDFKEAIIEWIEKWKPEKSAKNPVVEKLQEEPQPEDDLQDDPQANLSVDTKIEIAGERTEEEIEETKKEAETDIFQITNKASVEHDTLSEEEEWTLLLEEEEREEKARREQALEEETPSTPLQESSEWGGLIKKDPNIQAHIDSIVADVIKSLPPVVSATQVVREFSNMSNSVQRLIQERGVVKPNYNDFGAIYTRDEVVILLYYARHGKNLSFQPKDYRKIRKVVDEIVRSIQEQ